MYSSSRPVRNGRWKASTPGSRPRRTWRRSRFDSVMLFVIGPFADQVGRAIHRAKVHPSEVLTDDAEREQLRAAEDRDHRRDEREARHVVRPVRDVVDDDVREDEQAEDGEDEADDTRQLERERAEARRHVQGMRDQLANRVARRSDLAGIVLDRDVREPGGPPREQHIHGHVGPAIRREGITQSSPEHSERAHIPRHFGSHRFLQRELGEPRREVSKEPVLLGQRGPVHDVRACIETGEERGDLLRRVLQVIVKRDRAIEPGGTDPTEDRVVLAVVAAELHTSDSRVVPREVADRRPRAVRTCVLDEDDLVRLAQPADGLGETSYKLSQRLRRAVHGDDDGYPRGKLGFGYPRAGGAATLPRGLDHSRPASTSPRIQGMTSSSISSSVVEASKSRTSVALRTSGTRIWTSCSNGGSETYWKARSGPWILRQIACASSSTVVDCAVDRLTSSLTIRSDSIASRMPWARSPP